MAEIQEDHLDEQFYRDEGWIAQIGGGWIHANNGTFIRPTIRILMTKAS